MKQYFEEQIKLSKPLTLDNINKMKQLRIDKLPRLLMDDESKTTPKSSFGTVFSVGDIVLYFVERNGTNVSVKSVLLKELDVINGYKFESHDNKMPILIKP